MPVHNKMDLSLADPDAARQEIEDVIGIDANDAILASAKTGQGIEEILEMIVARVPAPRGDAAKPLQAVVIESWVDNYGGVEMMVRMVHGRLRLKDTILILTRGRSCIWERVGVFASRSAPRK